MEIVLSQGKVAIIDDSDYELISKYTWHVDKIRHIFYAKTNELQPDGSYKGLKMHRLIMGLQRGDGKIVDHRDGNGLNNQRSNLRIVTHAENMQNGYHVSASSGKLGVHKSRNKWRVNLRRNGIRYELGLFTTIEAAVKAREAFLLKLVC